MQGIELLTRRLRHHGRSQHASGAMHEQHAQVGVALFADTPQSSVLARRILFGRDAEPTGKVAAALHVGDIDKRRGHACSSHQADARHGHQQLAACTVVRHHLELGGDLLDAILQLMHLFEQHLHGRAQQLRQGAVDIADEPRHLGQACLGPHRNVQAKLATEAPHGVDVLRARGHPQRARSMHRLQGLLLDRLDAHRLDVAVARRFQKRRCVGRVRLVAANVGSDIRRRQQQYIDAQAGQPACPVMGRATVLHDHQRHHAVEKPALELRARQAVRFNAAPLLVGHAQLIYRFGQVNGHDHAFSALINLSAARTIHFGLLHVGCRPSRQMKVGWHIDAEKMWGSPSHQSSRRPQAPLVGTLRASHSGAAYRER